MTAELAELVDQLKKELLLANAHEIRPQVGDDYQPKLHNVVEFSPVRPGSHRHRKIADVLSFGWVFDHEDTPYAKAHIVVHWDTTVETNLKPALE